MGQGSRIKVAEVITRLDWGGSPDIVRILCDHLDPDIYDVTLITGSSEHMSQRTRNFLHRFDGTVLGIPSLRRDIDPFADPQALSALFRIFSREKFHIVHTHTAKAGALGRIAARWARVPAVVHTPHGHNFYGYFGPVMTAAIIRTERILSRYADKIIALTELEKTDFLRFKVAPDDKLAVICQGLELGGAAPVYADKVKAKRFLGVEDDEAVVGMIGRLEPVKGVKYFIEAAELVVKKLPKTKFIIVGDGSLRTSLEGQAVGAGLGKNVIFAGWRDDAAGLIPAFNLLALPSLNEAVGIVLIEAQAQGVPVVATSVGGIPEVVKDGETGILVRPQDAQGMAAAMIRLLEDEPKRMEMGHAARAWVEGKFRAEDMARKTSALYMQLLKKKGVTP